MEDMETSFWIHFWFPNKDCKKNAVGGHSESLAWENPTLSEYACSKRPVISSPMKMSMPMTATPHKCELSFTISVLTWHKEWLLPEIFQVWMECNLRRLFGYIGR